MDIKRFFKVAKFPLWVVGTLIVTLVVPYLLTRAGINIQGKFNTAVDELIGRDTAAKLFFDFMNGDYDRAISYTLISAALFIFLFGSYSFLWKPGKEALRRYKSPHQFYWSDRRLYADLGALSNELGLFVTECKLGEPAPRDNLNYVFDTSQDNRGATSAAMRQAMQKMDERRNYEIEAILKYSQRFSGRVRAALTEAQARNLVIGESEQQIIDTVFTCRPGTAYAAYQHQAGLLGTCAERLRESKRWLRANI